MGEWRDISLGEAIELKRGYDLPRQSRVPGTVPLISSSGLTDRHAVAMVKGPGVVTGRYGTLGKVFYVKEDFWPLNTTLYVRDFKGNNPRFISYFLESLDFSAYSDKAAVPGLNRNHLHEARVRLPFDVSEQEAIATTLGAIDDKIDLNRRTNETLESIARAIFKDWFVDFGPTRAKQEGRTPYLASDLWSLFPDRLDEEGKPAGWERIALREAADVFSGGTPAKDKMEFWNGTIPWISPKVMTDIHVTISDDRVTEHAIGRGTRMVPSGSVLVMVRGMGLHEGVRISQARCDVTFNQDVKALVGKRLSGTHLLFGLLDAAQDLFTKVEASGHGTGKLPTETIEGIYFVTPTGDPYLRLIGPLDALNDRIAANNAESNTLSALRNLLLPRLISGETRVKIDQTTFEART